MFDGGCTHTHVDARRSTGSEPHRVAEAPVTEAVGAVLCAGLGTRLRPATESTPKPAVPFHGVSLAGHSFRALQGIGIEAVGANLHYLPKVMSEDADSNVRPGVRLELCHEPAILGTGGGTREIWRALGPDKPLVLFHGDVVLGISLSEVLATHRASGAAATLVLKVRDGTTSLRGVFTDGTSRVAGILSHRRPGAVAPLVEHAFTGIQILEPELFDELPEEGPYCLVTQLYPKLLARETPIAAHLTTAFYADLGTYERYLQAQRDVFDAHERLPMLAWPDAVSDGVFASEKVVIEQGASVVGPVRLEGDVIVRSGARLGPYVSVRGAVEFHAGSLTSNASIWGRGALRGTHRDTLLHLPGTKE